LKPREKKIPYIEILSEFEISREKYSKEMKGPSLKSRDKNI